MKENGTKRMKKARRSVEKSCEEEPLFQKPRNSTASDFRSHTRYRDFVNETQRIRRRRKHRNIEERRRKYERDTEFLIKECGLDENLRLTPDAKELHRLLWDKYPLEIDRRINEVRSAFHHIAFLMERFNTSLEKVGAKRALALYILDAEQCRETVNLRESNTVQYCHTKAMDTKESKWMRGSDGKLVPSFSFSQPERPKMLARLDLHEKEEE